jgi:hypothetical protein
MRHEVSRKILLGCGIVSSLLYAAMIWLIRYEEYSPISQVPSELTAIGAPTQALWARLGWIYTALITAFGLGLWKSAGGNRRLRIVGGLILAYASLGLLWPFAPMQFLEAPRLQADLPTPWIGLWERINITVFLLWVVMLCVVLWRTGTKQGETSPEREARYFAVGGA